VYTYGTVDFIPGLRQYVFRIQSNLSVYMVELSPGF